MIKIPEDEYISHKKLVLKWKRDGKRTIISYKQRWLCAEKRTLVPRKQFLTRGRLCSCQTNHKIITTTRFEWKSFRLWKCLFKWTTRSTKVWQLPKHLYNGQKTTTKALRLERSLYGLVHAAMIWNKRLFHETKDNGFKGMETAICILIKKWMIIIYHLDDLTIFAEK